MKKITLVLCSFAISLLAISQANPCPDVQSSGFTPISSVGNTCTSSVFVNATGDVAANKSLRITVYIGNAASGIIVADSCYLVPGGSASTIYVSPQFSAPCDATITYVIGRSTNANCGGSVCGQTITVDAGPLPIALISFFATRSNGAVNLSWNTASESNAQAFIIQRSAGEAFVDIATVPAKNVVTGSHYSFTDKSNSSKVVSQYRLKMVDIDGSFKNSEIKVVKGSGAAVNFSLYPNPSNGSAKVSISDLSGPTDVQLIDNTGRVLKSILLTNTNSVNYNNLQNGMYMIRIVNKTTGETLTKKLTVRN